MESIFLLLVILVLCLFVWKLASYISSNKQIQAGTEEGTETNLVIENNEPERGNPLDQLESILERIGRLENTEGKAANDDRDGIHTKKETDDGTTRSVEKQPDVQRNDLPKQEDTWAAIKKLQEQVNNARMQQELSGFSEDELFYMRFANPQNVIDVSETGDEQGMDKEMQDRVNKRFEDNKYEEGEPIETYVKGMKSLSEKTIELVLLKLESIENQLQEQKLELMERLASQVDELIKQKQGDQNVPKLVENTLNSLQQKEEYQNNPLIVEGHANFQQMFFEIFKNK